MPSSQGQAEAPAPPEDWRKPRRVRGVKTETWRRLQEGQEINANDLADELGCSFTSTLNAIRIFGREVAPLVIRKEGHKNYYSVTEGELRRSKDSALPALAHAPRLRQGDVPDFDSSLLVSGINRDPKTGGVFVVLFDATSGRTWIADIRGSAG